MAIPNVCVALLTCLRRAAASSVWVYRGVIWFRWHLTFFYRCLLLLLLIALNVVLVPEPCWPPPGVTRRKQHRPVTALDANTTHVPTAGSSVGKSAHPEGCITSSEDRVI